MSECKGQKQMGYEEEIYLLSFVDDEWRTPSKIRTLIGKKSLRRTAAIAAMLDRAAKQRKIERDSVSTTIPRAHRTRVFTLEKYRRRQ